MSIKNIVIVTCIGLSGAKSVSAFPHTVILKNKTNITQIASITSSCNISNSPVQENDTIETQIAPGDSFIYGSQNHTFITLVIKVRSARAQNALVTGLGQLGQIATIELLDGGAFKTYTAGYFQQASLRAMAAKRAAAERWVQTKAWFSSLWNSIKTTFSSFFSRPAPSKTSLTGSNTQANREPMVTISNDTDRIIYVGGAFITNSGERTTNMKLEPEQFINKSFSEITGNVLLFDTLQYLTKPHVIHLKAYRDDVSQHSTNEELYIEVKQGTNNSIIITEPVWQQIIPASQR